MKIRRFIVFLFIIISIGYVFFSALLVARIHNFFAFDERNKIPH